MKILLSIIFFLYLYPAEIFSQNSKAEINYLNSLYNEKQFFKLKRHLDENAAALNDRHKLYYNALLDNAFNEPEKSNENIDRLFSEYKNDLTDSMKVNLYNSRLVNYVNLFKYKDAFEAGEILLSEHKNLLEQKEIDDLENSSSIFKSGFSLPPQTIEVTGDTRMETKKDLAGLVNIKVGINGNDEDFIFDTGANFSTVSESFAKKIGLVSLEGKLEVGTATSMKVSSGLAYAPSLNIGNFIFKNVLFLVLPDEALSFAGGIYVINGIIGFPVIKEMKEIHLTAGQIYIPEKPKASTYSNLALDGFLPVIETFADSDTLVFSFDTGAKRTIIYYPYYKKYKSVIDSKYEPADINIGGAGGDETLKGYKITEIEFRISDGKTILKNVSLLAEQIKDKDEHLEGNLGGDFFNSFKTMIINFEDMYVELEN